MTENAKLYPMGQSVQVNLSEAITYLDSADLVNIHMAVSRGQLDDYVLRDLLVDIFPQRWLNREDTPLTALRDGPFQYETGDCAYILLHARVKCSQIRNWFSNPGEHTLTAYDPRPGHSTLALSFSMPELQKNANAVHMSSNTSWGFSSLPWPNTLYECYAIATPGRLPTDISTADAYELVLANTWDADDLRTYRDFNAARVELIHGLSDPGRAYRFNDMIAIRLIHADGWLKDPEATRAEVAVTACGIDPADFIGKRCRLHIEEGQHDWGKSRIVPEPFQRMSFSLPAQLPAQLTLVLTRDTKTLDRVTVREFEDNPTQAEPEVSDVDHMTVPDEAIATGKAYEVVLSYAGENRDYVEEVAAFLQANHVPIFYDKYEEANLWGKDLLEQLYEIYGGTARYCVMFISQHYARKVWPTQERKAALVKAIQGKSEYILPARFDNTKVPGLLPTIHYVDLKKVTPEQLGELILKKLGRL